MRAMTRLVPCLGCLNKRGFLPHLHFAHRLLSILPLPCSQGAAAHSFLFRFAFCSLPVPPSACSVQYATGEVELLDLDEVIRDGHCSLLA